MAVDKSIISKIRRVVFSRFEPTSSLVMWGKPVGDKFTFWVFDKGAWEEVGASDGVYVPDVSVYLSAFTNDVGFVTESQLPDLSALDNLATVATSGSYNDLTDKPTIPSLSEYATQSWVNQQGFIKGYTETDPVFTASAAHGITSSDISNWNSKTSNVGTITGITMNGASKGTSGVVNLGTVITDVSGKVDKTTTINGKALSSNVTLNASDVGALPSSTVIPAAQVNADWNASSGVAQILNKPTIPTITFRQW
jgi:hypothetical protein